MAAKKQTYKINRMQRGSGIYTCASCGEQTRETGDGESSCNLCKQCFHDAGMENSHSDGYHDADQQGPQDDCPICQREQKAREAEIAAKAHDAGYDADTIECTLKTYVNLVPAHYVRMAKIRDEIQELRKEETLLTRSIREMQIVLSAHGRQAKTVEEWRSEQ